LFSFSVASKFDDCIVA